jgi:hypothetical protein
MGHVTAAVFICRRIITLRDLRLLMGVFFRHRQQRAREPVYSAHDLPPLCRAAAPAGDARRGHFVGGEERVAGLCMRPPVLREHWALRPLRDRHGEQRL